MSSLVSTQPATLVLSGAYNGVPFRYEFRVLSWDVEMHQDMLDVSNFGETPAYVPDLGGGVTVRGRWHSYQASTGPDAHRETPRTPARGEAPARPRRLICRRRERVPT